MRVSRALRLAFVPVMIATVLSGEATAGIGDIPITGTVKDTIGRPLSGVTVSDGSKSVTTDSQGAYSIDRRAGQSFTLFTSRYDLESASRYGTALPGTTINFTPYYGLSGSISRSYYSTAQGPATGTLSITSYAPQPGTPGSPSGTSCVYVTDSRTGSSSATNIAGTSWTWVLSLPAGSSEGTDTLSFISRDCSSNTDLSYGRSTTYFVDNTALSLIAIGPVDGSHSIFSSQPIVATVSDSGPSGIAYSGHSATVVGPNGSQTVPATFSGGYLKSSGASLVAGDYVATLTASDRAGNQSSAVTTFRKITASATGYIFSSLMSSTSSTPGSLTSLNDTYTWNNVPVQVDQYNVNLNGTKHGGAGTSSISVNPSLHAWVTWTNPLPDGPTQPPQPTQTRPLQNAVRTSTNNIFTEQTGNVAIQVPTSTVTFDQITAVVPKNASNVTLTFNENIGAAFNTCADPSTGSGCHTDPLTVNDRRDVWQPWANLVEEDPVLVPQRTGEILGLNVPANLCSGTPPSLNQAILNMSNALVQRNSAFPGTSPNPDFDLGAAEPAYARLVQCIATHIPLLPEVTSDSQVTRELRGRWLAATRDILSAIATLPTDPVLTGHSCADSSCLVYLSCQAPFINDTYTGEYIYHQDCGGSDTYRNKAGGSGGIGSLPIAIVNDLGGEGDLYVPNPAYTGGTASPVIGSGSNGGIGILIDDGGDNYLDSTLNGTLAPSFTTSVGTGNRGVGYLRLSTNNPPLGGTYNDKILTGTGTDPEAAAIGAGRLGGFGFLLDQAGDDEYTNKGFQSIGYGDYSGVGLLIDVQGSDDYLATAAGASNKVGWSIGAAKDIFLPNLASNRTAVGAVLDGATLSANLSTSNDSYSCGTSNPSLVPNFKLMGPCIGGAISAVGLVRDNFGGGDTYLLPAEDLSYLGPGGLGASSNGGLGLFLDDYMGVISGSRTTYACRAAGYGSLAGALFKGTISVMDTRPQCQPWFGTYQQALWLGRNITPFYYYLGGGGIGF